MINLLQRFEPEPDGLLRAISGHINDEMLEWISTADYGIRADEHLIALRRVRDTSTFPADLYWCPAEVMELIRWSEPEDPDWKPGRTGEFGHWMRAFCCAALLRATQEPWNYGDGVGTDSTVVQMTLSLCVLPVDFTAHAVKFLAWLLLNFDLDGRDDQVCSYAVCLLWFALRQPSPVAAETLISFAEWIVGRANELFVGPPGGNRGLREMVVTCQKSYSWELLALQFCEIGETLPSTVLQVRIQEIGKQMLDSRNATHG